MEGRNNFQKMSKPFYRTLRFILININIGKSLNKPDEVWDAERVQLLELGGDEQSGQSGKLKNNNNKTFLQW